VGINRLVCGGKLIQETTWLYVGASDGSSEDGEIQWQTCERQARAADGWLLSECREVDLTSVMSLTLSQPPQDVNSEGRVQVDSSTRVNLFITQPQTTTLS